MSIPPEPPIFRQDLDITPQPKAGQPPHYLVKDPETGHVLRISDKEHFICTQLDGSISLREVAERFRQRFQLKLSDPQLNAFLRQLSDYNLLVEPSEKLPARKWHSMKALPIDAESLFNRLASLFSWTYTPPARWAYFSLLLMAFIVLVTHWHDIVYQVQYLLAGPANSISAERVIQVLLFLVCIPLLRELAKGTTYTHYGYRVAEIRYRWQLHVIPRLTVNLAGLLRMPRKQKLYVLTSGMVIESILVALGIVASEMLSPANPLQSLATSLSIGAGVRLFFNANPLGQLDASYVLSLLTNTPNLRRRAVQAFRAWILGKPLPEPVSAKTHRRFVLFGLLVEVYSLTIAVAAFLLLGYLFTSTLQGLGALVFVTLIGVACEEQIRSALSRIPFLARDQMNATKKKKNKWGKYIRIALALAIVVLLCVVPYPFEVAGEFRVQPAQKQELRAAVEGLIQSIPVEEGDRVVEGDLIVQIDPRDIENELEITRALLRKEREQLRALEAGARPEEIARAEQKVRLAETALRHSENELRRAHELYEKEHISDQEYEGVMRQRDMDRESLELAKRELDLVKAGPRQEEIEAQRAEVERLEASLRHLVENLKRTTIVAPIDGQVTTLYMKNRIGQRLKVGDVVAIIEDNRSAILRIAAPEQYAGLITVGARIRARPWAYSSSIFTGRVTSIIPIILDKNEDVMQQASVEQEGGVVRNLNMPEERVIPLLAEMDNRQGLLKSEMTGFAKIEAGTRPIGFAIFHPVIRFLRVRVWSWIP